MRLWKIQYGLGSLLLFIGVTAVFAIALLPSDKSTKPYIEVEKHQNYSGQRMIQVRVVHPDSTSESYCDYFVKGEEDHGGALDHFVIRKKGISYTFSRPEFELIKDGSRATQLTPRMIENYAILRQFVAKNSSVDSIPWSEVAAHFDGTKIQTPRYQVRIPLTKDFQRAVPKRELEGL